ncbi:inositol 2-dehydrogenase [Cryobacterium roopkundense]|uniref:Inositol 2-dehydrogenase n=1 Tax=Cryobacterium roopkundense TaxID=1001240 RepID=A0A099J523_9MICO|nr:inositol 2-dehydrogenase [Cryobacterium roopkundense]KGJ72592.1 inositol 2-dehydrogenase [Cryobacterium roopkundense]MBB5642897.1 myo-inositol 2-dehydrogenase/D-chiro-inositol 1-dehydrogenase [Cryobacterium roopkundense]
MTTPLRFGLFGTGRIGQVHAASIASSPRASLQWVCDPFVDGANATAAKYGGRATAEPADLFAAEDIDALIIASSTPTHVELIDQALDAGIPVLCEKPIDLDITRVDALRAKADAATVPVVLGFNRRFDPHFAELQRRVASGEIGALEQLAIVSRDPAEPPAAYVAVSGGIFRDMTIHDFDMARFFLPNIVSVTARGANQFSPAIAAAGDFDAVVVTLEAEGGELVTITNSRHSAFGYDQRFEAFGSEGMLQVGNIGPSVIRSYSTSLVEAQGAYHSFFLERYADAYRFELEAFIDTVAGEPSRSPGFEDGRAALILADAAELSARTGRTVDVDLRA